MDVKNYETVFILTPVLSEAQMKDAVEKFKKILLDNSIEIVHEDSWGLRKLAYPIAHKNTGFYQLFEFKAPPTFISTLETEYRRDEKILRFLTTALDKHAVDYNDRKRKGLIGRKANPNAAEAKPEREPRRTERESNRTERERPRTEREPRTERKEAQA
ncbi:MAG: 30S ribosomal protein S6 [Ferruginibacter sp.]|nr:30S ribosomal protein S6 [Cytophagales bacterium]